MIFVILSVSWVLRDLFVGLKSFFRNLTAMKARGSKTSFTDIYCLQFSSRRA